MSSLTFKHKYAVTTKAVCGREYLRGESQGTDRLKLRSPTPGLALAEGEDAKTVSRPPSPKAMSRIVVYGSLENQSQMGTFWWQGSENNYIHVAASCESPGNWVLSVNSPNKPGKLASLLPSYR